MALKLMYITNDADIAKIAQGAGVDRIFIDMEYIGKSDRQGGMDTVQSRHTLEDIEKVRKVVTTSELLVRCNPIHDATKDYSSSEEEIDAIIGRGADIVMLPYFKTAEEVGRFIKAVGGRAKTMLLVETPSAAENIDDILSVKGIDEVLIGLNDLSLGYGRKFMFELLSDGTVEKLCKIFAERGFPYGFGGIASLGHGMLPSELVIKEHYRLGSTCAILSRSFCNIKTVGDKDEVRSLFYNGIKQIRELEGECAVADEEYFLRNREQVVKKVKKIVEGMI